MVIVPPFSVIEPMHSNSLVNGLAPRAASVQTWL